jgi:hypothetical protein
MSYATTKLKDPLLIHNFSFCEIFFWSKSRNKEYIFIKTFIQLLLVTLLEALRFNPMAMKCTNWTPSSIHTKHVALMHENKVTPPWGGALGSLTYRWQCSSSATENGDMTVSLKTEVIPHTINHKRKAVPLPTYGGAGERKYSSHSFNGLGTRKVWVVRVTPRPPFTSGKNPVPIGPEVGWAREPVWTEVTGKTLHLCRGSSLDRPVVQSVARHYTDWATPPLNY